MKKSFLALKKEFDVGKQDLTKNNEQGAKERDERPVEEREIVHTLYEK